MKCDLLKFALTKCRNRSMFKARLNSQCAEVYVIEMFTEQIVFFYRNATQARTHCSLLLVCFIVNADF